jgi:sorbitol-6-phosphate 2-dehydrogenase
VANYEYLKNKVFVVTGSSSGLGYSIAKFLIDNEAICYGIDVVEPDLKHDNFYYATFDITDEELVIDFFHTLYQKYENIDGLINNAGINYRQANIEAFNTKHIRRIFDINVMGPYLLTREYIKHQKRLRRGNILNSSSIAAMQGGEYESLYTSTKWALRGMTLSWAKELAIYGIACNEIEPGIPIKTNMSEQVYDKSFKKDWVSPDLIAPAYILACFPPAEAQKVSGMHFNAKDIMIKLENIKI